MTFDRNKLETAHCWFSTDEVTGRPHTTWFKRAARWQQYQWAKQDGLAIGWLERGGKKYLNGSKIEPSDANRQKNFLSPAICAAVEDRLAAPEPHQTLNPKRLRYDLLSSMPLCFNLFGELHADQNRARTAVRQIWGLSPDQPVEVRFEHSPGRLDPDYLGDRTAFDAALLVGDPTEPRTVIGIETKYHEHPEPEDSPDEVSRMPRYRQVANASGAFKPGWEKSILGTELQQLWRDHLLVLAMIQHGDARTDSHYVLVHPGGNASFAEAATRYRETLTDASTFQVLTIEQLLDKDVLHTPATAQRFRERYFW